MISGAMIRVEYLGRAFTGRVLTATDAYITATDGHTSVFLRHDAGLNRWTLGKVPVEIVLV